MTHPDVQRHFLTSACTELADVHLAMPCISVRENHIRVTLEALIHQRSSDELQHQFVFMATGKRFDQSEP